MKVVGQKCARQFVAVRPGGSCGGDEQCLAELARACGGQRALYVSVYPFRPQMVFVGKLVRSDGLLERSVSNLEVSRSEGRLRPEMIRPGIERVLTEGLRVEALDLQPLVAAPLVAAVDPPASTVPAEPRAGASPAVVTSVASRGASGQRIAAYACVGVGAVALAVGTALLFAGKSDEDAYRQTLDPYGQRPPTPDAAAAQDSLRSKSTPVTIALVAGAALVATGVTLWVLDGSKPETAHVELRPGPGGGNPGDGRTVLRRRDAERDLGAGGAGRAAPRRGVLRSDAHLQHGRRLRERRDVRPGTKTCVAAGNPNDKTPPVFSIVVTPPPLRQDTAKLTEYDPGSPDGGRDAFRRDESVAVTVTSRNQDVDAGSVKVLAHGVATNPGTAVEVST